MIKFAFILPSPKSFSTTEEFENTVRKVAELGYDAIELQLGDASDIDVLRLKKLLKETGLKLSSFQTGSSYAKNGFCYTAQSEEKRRGAVEKMHGFIKLAHEFQAKPVTGLMQGCQMDELDARTAYERIYAAMRETSEEAEKLGVTVVIEPCNKMEVGFNNTVARVIETVETVNSSALLTMVDTYHANIEERDVCEALVRCAPYMRHVHLSETNRSDFGTGHLDFVSVFDTLQKLDFDGYCAIGVYFTEQNILDKAEQAIRYAKAALRMSELKCEVLK